MGLGAGGRCAASLCSGFHVARWVGELSIGCFREAEARREVMVCVWGGG
jgi:hypothetical protein